jgi:hypothetical protein
MDERETFKTAYDYTSNENTSSNLLNKDVKLPNLVNFVALRETFLSECPFVTRSNKSFWKKCIDSKFYVNILAASLKFVSECIGENGTVYLDKFYDISSSIAIKEMSLNIAELVISNKVKFSRSNELLFKKLPELLCFMIVSSLQSIASKHTRLYNATKFREILLDWLTEIINGFRITDCKKDREWLFSDTNDSKILTLALNNNNHNNGNNTTNSFKTKKTENDEEDVEKNIENEKKLSTAITNYIVSNSPLVDIYFKLGKNNGKKKLKFYYDYIISV